MECGGTLGRCSTGPVPPSPVAPIPPPPAGFAMFGFGTVFVPGGLVSAPMLPGGDLFPPDDDDDDDPLEIHDL